MSNTERPKAGAVEKRHLDGVAVEGRKIHGLIPYGVESRDMGGWTEVIEPGALDAAKLDDLVAVVDHAGVPLARYPTTLNLEDRSDGLHWSLTPPESRADVREAIERGDLKAGSWRMIVGREEWRGDTRHVREIAELRDVSIATAPAYSSATVEYRSAPITTPGDDREKEHTDMSDTTQKPEEKVEDRSEEKKAEARVVAEPEPVSELKVEDRASGPQATSLAELYESRGFFENRSASISWDEYRAFTFAGGTVSDINPIRPDHPELGYDRRWLFPVVPNIAVDEATTSVQYLRQSDRVLAGTAVIRPLAATSTKPETSGTAELSTLTLEQVATVSSGIPRIYAAQPAFSRWIEQDLRLAVNDGLDEQVRRGVATAGTAAAVTGNVLDKIRKARTVVEAEGYSPNVVAIDPAGAEELDLLKSSGTEELYVFQPGSGAPGGPWGLQVRVWKTAGTAVLDTNAFGSLYISPINLAAFEADGGLTNTQNVRLETNAGFAVERVSAALRIV